MHNHEAKTGLAGHKHSPDPATRKEELLREGEFYRAGVAHAKASIQYGIKPEVMLHSAMDHATWALRARADALLKPTGTNVSVLLPYALGVVNFVRQRRMGKQAAGAALVMGALGWYVNRKRARQSAE